jgi:hypothetical protein
MGLFDHPRLPGNGVLANTSLLLLVEQGKTPLVTCGVTEDAQVYRLSLEVLGAGYGVSVHLRGPLSVLHTIVTELGVALDQQH